MYDTREEANQKVVNSVVLLNDVPVIILDARGTRNNVELQYRFVPYAAKKDLYSQEPPNDPWLPIADSGWDFRTIASKLGYVNYTNSTTETVSAVFISRNPARTSRQGLDNRVVEISRNFADKNSVFDFSNIYARQKSFVDMIKGNYPTTRDVFKRMLDTPDTFNSMAIGRKLALAYDRVSPPFLIYREQKIGYTEDGDIFKLAKHKEFLREELTDIHNLKVA